MAHTQVSNMTLRRRLRKRNLPVTPLISQACTTSSINVAKRGNALTGVFDEIPNFIIFRQHIDFSDESHFQLYPDDKRRLVWRHPGQRGITALTSVCHTVP
ncbi:hypothetical protein TNCV_286141 [Trichonephila clavipes]|nr:hypothetical protein TNCV_286141 [Trichonephila clavipes]